jgi:hypothetical protein
MEESYSKVYVVVSCINKPKSRVDRAVRNGKVDCFISIDDFLVNDVIDRDEVMSISLDLMVSILGGNDEGKVSGYELSMKAGSMVDSGVMVLGI